MVRKASKSKAALELLNEQAAHRQTRVERDEAYQAAQYLKLKVDSLRATIARVTRGQVTSLPLPGYSYELEGIEQVILERAALRQIELEEAPTEPDDDSSPSEDPEPPPKRQRRARKTKAQEFASSPPTLTNTLAHTQPAPIISSDGLSVNPADLLVSRSLPTDTTLPSDPWSDAIDPEILAQQVDAARKILGDLAECPVSKRILQKPVALTQTDLERMRDVLEEDVDARVDFAVFTELLLGE